MRASYTFRTTIVDARATWGRRRGLWRTYRLTPPRAPPRSETGRCDGFDRRLDFASGPRVRTVLFSSLYFFSRLLVTSTRRAGNDRVVVRSFFGKRSNTTPRTVFFYDRDDFRTFRVSFKRTDERTVCLRQRNVRTVQRLMSSWFFFFQSSFER